MAMRWDEFKESVGRHIGPHDHDSDGSLRPDEAAHLRLETMRFKHPGAKEEAIRSVLGTSAAVHFQIVNALLDRPESMEHNGGEFATTVNRLRRIRDEKKAKRPSLRQN